MKPFILELGVEELPPFEIESLEEQLKENFVKVLNEERFEFSGIRTYSTPRRIAVFVQTLSDRGRDVEMEEVGPPLEIAKKEGRWTRAAEGFARRLGISVDELYEVRRGNKVYVAGRKVQKGRSIEDVLQDRIGSIISSLRQKKTMRWLPFQNIPFIRPIRWILALYGDRVISFTFLNLRSDRYTYGHRLLSGKLEVPSAQEYERILKENYVIPDRLERYEMMMREIEEEKGNLEPYRDESLYREINGLVEYPQAVVGQFDEVYLELPERVVITAMKVHQRYIALFENGRLASKFIAIINNLKEYRDNIVPGLEKVLKARLEDARFYYVQDTKKPLIEYLEELRDIVWHTSLGSMYDKVMRVKDLSLWMADKLGARRDVVERASLLYRNDLATLMIRDGKEFTELEGYIASEYARASGENPEVVQAIYDYTLMEEPRSLEGAILAIADRLDTIVGILSTGYRVKGSYDPLGIKKALYGIFDTIIGKGIHLDINAAIEKALEIYGLQDSIDDYSSFVFSRLENYLEEKEGIRWDIVDAVINSGLDDIYEIYARAKFLNRFRRENPQLFEEIVTGQKRAGNILKKADSIPEVRKELLKDPHEKQLYETAIRIRQPLEEALAQKDYPKAMELLLQVKGKIDAFFDNVFVMVDDDELRNNRLALLKMVKGLFDRMADFSRIQIEGK